MTDAIAFQVGRVNPRHSPISLSVYRWMSAMFATPEDWLWLDLFIDLVGAMDDPSTTRTAGRYGFTIGSTHPADGPLQSRLRQHRWRSDHRSLGDDGEHSGADQPEHLRRFVLPLFE